MNLLLDTHVIVWWLLESPKLGKHSRNAILKPGASVFISSISVWEIATKAAADKIQLRRRPLQEYIADLIAKGFHPLPITFDHALAVQSLPAHHSDPFDRMLIAQAQCEDLTIVTADPAIETYDVRTLHAGE